MLENTALIESSNHLFALITLIGLAFVAIWIVDLLFGALWMPAWKKKMYAQFERFALPFGFFVSLFAMIGSLYYSYYLHIAACDLCWLQRIFIYPLVFIFGMAWYKNDRKIFDYVMLLSGVGFVIALYHHYLQLGYDLLKPCSTAPFAVDCATPTFIEYGFVTYPLMGVVTFALTFLISFSAKRFQK
jgi:disulfide bond formation protein DsbB